MTGVFVVIVVLSAVAALSDLSLVHYLQEFASGSDVDVARAEQIDDRQAVLGLLQSGAGLACATVFLMWFHRAHKNLRSGGLRGLRYSPRWAVGGFFIPFLNLVRPIQVMNEVWKGSAHLAESGEKKSWTDAPLTPHVGVWWALFLIASLLGRVSTQMALDGEEVEAALAAGWATFASDVADIPAALAALFLVRRVTDLQERARMRIEAEKKTVARAPTTRSAGASLRR